MKVITFLPIIASIIAALMIICSNPEREIEYTYTAEFDLAAQVDLGDPLFYKIDRYYVYISNVELEENIPFYPDAMAPSFIGMFHHDSLFTVEDAKAHITFKSKEYVSHIVVFASGFNRFMNTRFSAGQRWKARIVE